MTARHTPTPWFISRDPRPDMEWNNHIACVANPNLEICAMFHTKNRDDNETGEANADLIVTAVNAHDALTARVAELEKALQALVEATLAAMGAANMTGDTWEKENIPRMIQEALNKAQAQLAKGAK